MASEKADELMTGGETGSDAQILVKVDHEDQAYMAGETIQGHVLIYFPNDVKVQG